MENRAPDWGEILCQHILVHLSRRELCFALSMSTPDAYLGTLHSLKPRPAISKKAQRIVESSSQEPNGLLLVRFMAMAIGKPSEHAARGRAWPACHQHQVQVPNGMLCRHELPLQCLSERDTTARQAP